LEQLKHSLCHIFSNAFKPADPNALPHPEQVFSLDELLTEEVEPEVGIGGRVAPGSGVVDRVVPHEEQKRALGLIVFPQLSQNIERVGETTGVLVGGELVEGLVKEGVLVPVKLAFRVIVEGTEVLVGA